MSNWDSEIDDAARRMTDGPSPAGFTERVLARIDESATPRRQRWPMWVWSPVAVAAASLVVVLVRAPWRPPPTGMRPSGTDAAVQLKPDTTSAVETSAGPKPDSAAPAEPAVVVSGLSRTRSAVVSGSGRTMVQWVEISELAPPSLVIDSIGVESMENMESLEVPRLAVAMLDVPAIGGE